MFAHPIEFLDLLNGQVQYVVPRWQRRYCWGQSDIERLVEDLLTVASAGPNATHYGGTLLTFPDPGAAGVVKTIRVVDGQQRLTTISILLACIAAELGPEGQCGEWTKDIIVSDRLTNPRKPPEKRRKLRLQNGDEEEYRLGLDGHPEGAGAVAQAWRIARRLVARSDVPQLLTGLERLRVVSIGLAGGEDPQQIFESLNATGRPLTESEKVKNWLLMGLPDEEQQELHDNFWKSIEQSLGAEYTTQPTDLFLRDLLRWRTGKVQGIDRVYEALRRWAVREGHAHDRSALCRDLARLAQLYGILTDTAGPHPEAAVERELRHLRALGIDIHRPLTLRFLHEHTEPEHTGMDARALAATLAAISTWTTRLWLADQPTAGMNRAIVELAHSSGPEKDENVAEYWNRRIQRFRNSRVGVPNDEEVREGIRTRKAYGGSATRSSRAVLCTLMEAEHREEAPPRSPLTIEHVMTQTLTEEWKRDLGPDAQEIHGRYRNRLGNLTLSGDVTNSEMGAGSFLEKRRVYARSSIGLTRRIAQEEEWGEAEIAQRAEVLADDALKRWPWRDPGRSENTAKSVSTGLKWRIGDGPWREETGASQMVLNVAAALLSLDPANADRLSGEAISSNLQLASRYPPDTAVGSLTLRAVPGHDEYVLYPYGQDYSQSVVRCMKMGEQCGVPVQAVFEDKSRAQEFWRFFKEHTGGVPGQTDSWRGPGQWTKPFNSRGDKIGMYIGNSEQLWVYIRSGQSHVSQERTARMRRYSWMIREQMSDQLIGDNLEKTSVNGTSISVCRHWTRDDEAEWPGAAEWLWEQSQRLRAILTDEAGQSD